MYLRQVSCGVTGLYVIKKMTFWKYCFPAVITLPGMCQCETYQVSLCTIFARMPSIVSKSLKLQTHIIPTGHNYFLQIDSIYAYDCSKVRP